MKDNFWDMLMGDDAHAAEYMVTYNEGPGCETRHTIGSFIEDGESVLDVGCGPGWNLDHFQEYGPSIGQYRGLDYSNRFVRVANERWQHKAITLDTLKYDIKDFKPPLFELGDCRSLKEPDGSFDVVILQDVLEHTNGYETPVKEALRVARKRVIISFWHLKDTDNEHINDDGNDGWGAWYDKQQWEAFLDSLALFWVQTESSPEANRHHLFYVIDKEE